MNEASENQSDLARLIQEEMAGGGAFSLARFWELALYHPRFGYYEKEAPPIGAAGDFITSVSVGPVFGRLLARQFAAWLEMIPGPRQIVEAGAHHGQLALDILSALDEHGPQEVEYWILEPSANQRRRQGITLGKHLARVRWIEHWEAAAAPSVHGIIFANELLDAFPCHRFSWNAARRVWFEWEVSGRQNRFVWRRADQESTLTELTRAYVTDPLPGIQELVNLAERVEEVLPDGFTLDLSFAAEAWWRQAARRLGQGRLLTLDYGREAGELIRPERSAGTLRAYRGHHPIADCLADPGFQDLTADVNFSALRLTGETLGLETEHYESQARFLTRILQLGPASSGRPPNWSEKELRQFKILIHPDHFGRAFQVLAQRAALA